MGKTVFFSKKLKAAGNKCHEKSDSKLSREEKVTKVVKFLSRQLIPVTLPSFKIIKRTTSKI